MRAMRKVIGVMMMVCAVSLHAGAYTMQTSKTNHIVNVGTIDKSLFPKPVFVTSFGQSTDGAMLQTVMKRIGVPFTYNPTATDSEVAGAKMVVVAVGASTKGLGAAGVSEADEMARARKVMARIQQDGIPVVFVHIGGETRRGALSDSLADLVLPVARYLVVKEDANFDGKFTDYAKANGKPISLIFATRDTIDVFTKLLK